MQDTEQRPPFDAEDLAWLGIDPWGPEHQPVPIGLGSQRPCLVFESTPDGSENPYYEFAEERGVTKRPLGPPISLTAGESCKPVTFVNRSMWFNSSGEGSAVMSEAVKRVLKNKWLYVALVGVLGLLSGGAYSEEITKLLFAILGG